ncbi:purple acid phosphatase family protein [Mucilaginibacter terrae]|uniref:3',5'-cyclic AMP phosphodiesterase CpdA n=1 Tax=Mucilaginibacter terrae TaxID=1955052 RepID=A0ABU3GMI2_9SPHI|nr:metallophosphoesterase family protein [Mucilaginibacter terrae]MDT3400998.1 3',5'-cyclic AMP phosphodiesterase CpdA [Mucilaginibacter terrae]
MAVTWNSAKRTNGIVRYGLDSLRLKQQVESADIKVKGGNDSSYNYKAEIKNLNPGTRYYYQCGSEAGGWSAVYTFKTAPIPGKKGKYTIGVWGDTQNNAGNLAFEQTSKIVDQLAKFPLDLSIHMGDIVENGSVENSWFDFLKIAQPVTSKAPFMPVVGNHDVVNNIDQINFQKPFQIFYNSFQLPNQYLNYSYDYGNVHFVAINSGFAQGAAKVGKVLLHQNSPDYIWLEKDLSAARKNKNVTWIILYTHYPVYSFGVSHIQEWQHNLSPILDRYKVDLCLSGHRHVYERHKAIRTNAEEDLKFGSYYDHSNGTVYITNGSSGGSLQGVGGFNMSSIVFTPKEKTFTYAIMTVDGNSIHYDVYDQNDHKIDFFKIVK